MPSPNKRRRIAYEDDVGDCALRPRATTESTTLSLKPDADNAQMSSDARSQQTMAGFVEDMRSSLTCPICFRLLYQPYTSPCGHTHCYTCLSNWFDSTATDHGARTPNCPDCRSKVQTQPAPAFLIRDMVASIIKRPELLAEDETVELHEQFLREEQIAVENDGEHLFKGRFVNALVPRLQAYHDAEDGVDRCPECTWELDEDVARCLNCGWVDQDMEEYLDDEDDDDDDDDLEDFYDEEAEEVAGRSGNEGGWSDEDGSEATLHGNSPASWNTSSAIEAVARAQGLSVNDMIEAEALAYEQADWHDSEDEVDQMLLARSMGRHRVGSTNADEDEDEDGDDEDEDGESEEDDEDDDEDDDDSSMDGFIDDEGETEYGEHYANGHSDADADAEDTDPDQSSLFHTPYQAVEDSQEDDDEEDGESVIESTRPRARARRVIEEDEDEDHGVESEANGTITQADDRTDATSDNNDSSEDELPVTRPARRRGLFTHRARG